MNIYLDLTKAFDTVDHNFFLSKLNHYGVKGTEQFWFRSYLTDVQQTVKITEIKATHKSITVGVPQDSILGPLLFTMMINNAFHVTKVFIVCYAYDSTIIAEAETSETLLLSVNRAMDVCK